ncbi:MAG: DNA polymerase III subunit delta [Clostridia bacterium]|nr:DNA polymerase III subunit delta [Clostridia bacterium]
MREILSDAEWRGRMLSGKEANGVGGFLFFGEEDYLKLHALKTARQALVTDPSLAVFNDMELDGSAPDFSAEALASALSAAPMMADRKLVVVSGLNLNDKKTAEIDALCEAILLLDSYDFNCLILSVPAGGIDEGYLPKRPSAVLEKLCERLTPVRFARVGDAKLGAWALRHFSHYGVTTADGVVPSLLQRCGRDMFVLSGEIEKLCFFALAHGKTQVDVSDVENVTCENEELSAFALSNAVAAGDAPGALDALGMMKARRVEPVIVLGELSRTLGEMLSVRLLADAGQSPAAIASTLKLHEFRVKNYIKTVKSVPLAKLRAALHACVQADSALKLSPTGYAEIEKLICML